MFRNPLVDALVVLIAALLIFGPKRLPMVGRGLGQGMREFKDSITGQSRFSEEDEPPALTESAAPALTESAAPAAAASPAPAGEAARAGSSETRS
ncbi:MAG TPA: twin-arginine translocase TatA/TatE family subunit [Solirubrobacteraceae bacterium]|nr:twin-arginine translocase TatA/TatE family subunit [Solirubrobacteraceae bacterium]